MKFYTIDKKLKEIDSLQSETSMLITLSHEEWLGETCRQFPHHGILSHHLTRIPYCLVQLFSQCTLGTLCIPGKGEQAGLRESLGFYITDQRFYFIGNEMFFTKLIHRSQKHELPSAMTPMDLLLFFFNQMLDDDNAFLMNLEKALTDMEETALEKAQDKFYRTLSVYRKELRAYASLYDQLYNVSLVLQSNPHGSLTKVQCEAVAHFENRTRYLIHHVDGLKDYTFQIRDIYQAHLDMKQVRAMNILTVISAIFLPLTLIAGWYGMNFHNMPELGWVFSYPAVILASVAIVGIEIWIFKKKDLL